MTELMGEKLSLPVTAHPTDYDEGLWGKDGNVTGCITGSPGDAVSSTTGNGKWGPGRVR